jgi:hypothetical protein
MELACDIPVLNIEIVLTANEMFLLSSISLFFWSHNRFNLSHVRLLSAFNHFDDPDE